MSPFRAGKVEATAGVEPANKGFADPYRASQTPNLSTP